MEAKIQFIGIDKWNRPVYKVIKTSGMFVSEDKKQRKIYYGSVDKLFNDDATKEEVDNYFKDNLDELEFFGNHFGCEPMGGRTKNLKLIII